VQRSGGNVKHLAGAGRQAHAIGGALAKA
jgi:hypothetical protein